MGPEDSTLSGLFGHLPDDPAPLRPGDAVLLRDLPVYPETEAIGWDGEAACRRLERRGLVKIERHKTDPIAMGRTLYAGRLA